MKFGLLLPHFGADADAEKILSGSRRAEQLGFDSVWVRDHAVFEPHGGLEDANTSFYEAFTTLAVVGAVTSEILLGTGALIPIRHPILTASIASTITNLVGPRLVLGVGSGNFDAEFAALGLGGVDRAALVEESVSILRGLWAGEEVTRVEGLLQLERVRLSPLPSGGGVPIWYCGNAPASVRRAVRFAEGWMPGRISLKTYRARVALLRRLAEAAGRDSLALGVIPPTCIDARRDAAVKRANLEAHLAWANKVKYWVKPASGRFETLADLEGALIAGDPDDVVETCEKYRDAGCDHLVFDLRGDFARWHEQIELLGTRVLPHCR